MPLPKKLSCLEAQRIASEFFTGVSVKELAKHFSVSRLTVTRLIERVTYKNCKHLNIMVDALGKAGYAQKVTDQMELNRHRGRGNTRAVSL